MSMEQQRHRDEHRSYARAWRWGVLVSVLFHAALFLIFSGEARPPSPFAAAGERQGDLRAARGGGLEALEVRLPERIPTPPEPVATPVPEPAEEPEPEPELEVELEDMPPIVLADALAPAGPPGPEADRGLPDGLGAGDGGTEEEGRFRVIPPRPRGMILPPGDRPSGVRGKEVEVWVYVSPAGRVVADSTRLLPPTGDRRFDRRLRDHAAGWVFEAARRDGRAVAEWFRYTIVM